MNYAIQFNELKKNLSSLNVKDMHVLLNEDIKDIESSIPTDSSSLDPIIEKVKFKLTEMRSLQLMYGGKKNDITPDGEIEIHKDYGKPKPIIEKYEIENAQFHYIDFTLEKKFIEHLLSASRIYRDRPIRVLMDICEIISDYLNDREEIGQVLYSNHDYDYRRFRGAIWKVKRVLYCMKDLDRMGHDELANRVIEPIAKEIASTI